MTSLYAQSGVHGKRSRWWAVCFIPLAFAGAAAWWWAQATHQLFTFDFAQAWAPDRAVFFGGAGYGHVWSAYPLPAVLLFLPVGLLSAPAATLAGALLTALFLVLAMFLVDRPYGETGEPVRTKALRVMPVVISLPVIEAVQNTQAFSALGLLALVAAVWARREGTMTLFGVAAALALVRPINALPVLLCCLPGLRPSGLARAAFGATIIAIPLVAAAYLIDGDWPAQYLAALNAYSSAGLYRLFSYAGGLPAYIGLLVAVGAAAALAVARGRDLADMAYLAMAATVLLTPTNGIYTAVFALPALVQIGARRGREWFPWAASGAAWIATLAATPWLFGSSGVVALSLLSGISYWFVLNAYPLLSRSSNSSASTASL